MVKRTTTYKLRLRVPDDIAAMLCKMHPHLKKKVKTSMQEILADPSAGKALRDDLMGLRSYRVSRFRIIYRLSKKNAIDIIAVGPRRNIYEETLRLITRENKKKGVAKS